jgi:outer membrane protein OmpA-like peptidoglycan-associated protein
MGWLAIGAGLICILASGCSILKPKEETAAPVATDQGERKLVSIQQSDTQRDITTGERRFVFCSGKDCTATTQKSAPPRPKTVVVPRRRGSEAEQDGVRTFRIGFDYDRSTLNEAGLMVLEEASAFAADKKALEIRIHGKADSHDRDAYNLKLAERRARTVERFLKGKKLAAKLIVDASVVRVSADGVYPPGEAFKGRRVDLDIVIEVVSANKQVP